LKAVNRELGKGHAPALYVNEVRVTASLLLVVLVASVQSRELADNLLSAAVLSQTPVSLALPQRCGSYYEMWFEGSLQMLASGERKCLFDFLS
jgi:hypothetical protein